jgi:D-alanyl-D-alanine dipeptidase
MLIPESLRLPEPWLSNQTPKMRPYKMSVLLVAGMALVSTDANASGPFVDVRSVDPTITVELRYAGRNNFLGHSLYPVGTRALARPEVASALAVAQSVLRRYQYGLKIWDAYRPAAVQAELWKASHNSDYVANPEIGVGSLHSSGVAVDATLVDSRNRDVRMPTDFDEFTPAAMEPYMGSSFEIGGTCAFAEVRYAQGWFWGLTH